MEQIVAFANEILTAVSGWKGMPVEFVMAGVVTLLVSSLKVDLIRAFFWDKLGVAKVFVAPSLSLVGALLVVEPFTWATAWVALSTGAGAIAIHEILSALKPFVSPLLSKVLDLVMGLFKKQ